MAAVTLATSCNKDDDTNAPEKKQNASPQEKTIIYNPDGTVTIPYSIKYSTGKSLDKKMSYSDDGMVAKYEPTEDDVIKVSGEGVSGTLTLQYELSDFGGQEQVFKGNLTAKSVETATKLTNNEISLTYEYGTALEKPASSNVSLKALMESCDHLYTAKGNYSDKEFTLTDQNAYLAISMSPCCNHDITINGKAFVVEDGRIWIAVPGGKPVKSTGLGTELDQAAEDVVPGTIHTVARQYFTVINTVNNKDVVKKIYFSKGNLQYNVTDGANPKWKFADNQWDFVGGTWGNTKVGTVEGCTNTGAAGPWIDLFGWGTWLEGYDPSNMSQSGYPSENEYKAGTTAIGKEWVVLQTNDDNNSVNNEWKYLFVRKDLSKTNLLFGNATIEGIAGVVVLPDDWKTPDGITFKSGYGSWSRNVNVYNEDQWKIMEAAGAVFLPKAGQRDGESFSYLVNGPGYWSSTSKTTRTYITIT